MQWTDKINSPHQVPFTLAPYVDTPIKLDGAVEQAVRKCPFKSAVYIVFCNGVPQYVGQSGDVGKRFIAGVGKSKGGYVWPKIGGNFTVYFFEMPSADHFRKAVEMEVMLLVRLHTGFWPIESSGVNPFHQLKSSNEINLASTRALEIFNWLFTLNPKFAIAIEECSYLLEAFKKAEVALGR